MRTRHPVGALLSLSLLLPSALAVAQPAVKLPDPSPAASVTQTVGLTDITVSYHRPAVNKRKIWGELVPLNEVWRAGANENTKVSFSSPVSIQGQKLAAGTYGLHMIPTDKAWTVIFSTASASWGSYSYDQKEDAARITVTPQLGELEERLAYTFDEPSDNSVILSLRWEKLKVPFKIEIDTPAVVAASLRGQLRGLGGFTWQAWNQAARWCLTNNTNLDEALKWVDRSIGLQEGFQNLETKAGLLEKKGDAKTAAALHEKAFKLANEADLNNYGYQLMGQGKMDQAIEILKKNVKDHPASWNAHDSLAEAYLKKGDKKQAIEGYNKALSLVSDPIQKKRISEALAKLRS